MNLAHLLLTTARDLRSDGSNPEYDRALVELTRDAIGLSVESDAALAALIHRGPSDTLAPDPQHQPIGAQP